MKVRWYLKVGVLYCFCHWLGMNHSFAQSPADSSLLEVSEVIVPQGEKLKHQKNLYYEIYTSRTTPAAPSYWYKVIFIKDCGFQLSLFPLYEQDTYDFHIFKLSPDMEICKAIGQKKLISCDSQRIYKDYNDDVVKSKTDAGFQDLKEVKVKAGDAVYIEVFNTRGKDCGHIFELKTTAAFFVIKLINKKCPPTESYSTDTTIPVKKYQTVDSEKEAIAYLKKTFCEIKENELQVMSIKMHGENPTFKAGIDFVAYSKSLDEQIKKDSTAAPAKKATMSVAQLDSIMAAKKAAAAPQNNDNALATNPPPAKSTADLEETTPALPETNSTRTRPEIDKVLFTLLINDLKEKINANNEDIKEYNAKLKKTKTRAEREALTANIKRLKEQNIQLQEKSKLARLKLKSIQKLIAESKKAKIKTS